MDLLPVFGREKSVGERARACMKRKGMCASVCVSEREKESERGRVRDQLINTRLPNITFQGRLNSLNSPQRFFLFFTFSILIERKKIFDALSHTHTHTHSHTHTQTHTHSFTHTQPHSHTRTRTPSHSLVVITHSIIVFATQREKESLVSTGVHSSNNCLFSSFVEPSCLPLALKAVQLLDIWFAGTTIFRGKPVRGKTIRGTGIGGKFFVERTTFGNLTTRMSNFRN
jgi:hypothetical protein